MFNLLSFVLLFIPMFFAVIETCVIDQCIPEFAGTYDDQYDELLAVDWSIADYLQSSMSREERYDVEETLSESY